MKQHILSITLTLITVCIFIIWGWSYTMNTITTPSLPWEIYDNSLYLSGLLAIALMSVTMMLATRPAWLEAPFNGLDKIYRLHKWMAILAVVFAALHWLIEMGDDVIKSLFGRDGRSPEQDFSGFIEMMRDAAEDVGEWAVYLVFAMLVLTLWKRFPYNIWRYVHRVMPILYLLVVFHAVLLAGLVATTCRFVNGAITNRGQHRQYRLTKWENRTITASAGCDQCNFNDVSGYY